MKLNGWYPVILCLAALLGPARAAEPPALQVQTLAIAGEIRNESITCTLDMTLRADEAGGRQFLSRGNLTYLGGTLPAGVELIRSGSTYEARIPTPGWLGRPTCPRLTVQFAVLAVPSNDWRCATFELPEATTRPVVLLCDREDLAVQLPGAVQVDRKIGKGGKLEITAYLKPGASLEVRWKPEVGKLKGGLAVTCDSHTVASASVGAMKINSLFTYRVVQGQLEHLVLDVPDQLNITQVAGEDIREWHLEARPEGGRLLTVALSRPQTCQYSLTLEGERVLSAFPCTFDLPVIAPRSVIRAGGFLLLGTDSAVRLIVNTAAGLTQIDPAALPGASSAGRNTPVAPQRITSAYQYAHLPFQMALSAEDIVPSLSGEERLTLACEENGVTLEAALDVEIRDAPVRELVVETDPAWVVAHVQGANVSDYDVRDQAGTREIHIYLQNAILGHTLVTLRLDRSFGQGFSQFSAPRLALHEAKSTRGYLVLKAEKGIRLKEQQARELREVHTASLPFRVTEAQRAYRFKSPDWALQIQLEQADASVHAELFHLITVGEGSLYGSISITYRIEGAPVRSFAIRIPERYRNIEFIGRDIRGWERNGEQVNVVLQEKVMGDYTLLLTFEQQLPGGGSELAIGAVETIGLASEVGYIALSGPARLEFQGETGRDASMIAIAGEELPREYALLVNDPVMRAYKYVRTPHTARLTGHRFNPQDLLDRVADHITLQTRISAEGEAVTEASYYVKNTSQQFLNMTLPAGARLWSSSVDGENVQALNDGKGSVLIPIKRLRDANTPSRVDLTYAETRPALHWLSTVSLEAPRCNSQSVFARWTVLWPDRFALRPQGGNMMPAEQGATGLVALLSTLGALTLQAWRLAPLAWLCGVAAAGLLFLLSRRAGLGLLWRWPSAGLLAGLLLAGLVALLSVSGTHGRSTPSPFPAGGASPAPGTSTFTKSVTLSDHDLEISLRALPRWLGGGDGLSPLVLGALGGLAMVSLSLRNRRRPLAFACGMTLLLWGLSATPASLVIAASLLAIGFPLGLLAILMRYGYETGVRRPGIRDAESPVPALATSPGQEHPPGEATSTSGNIRIGVLLALAGTFLLAALARGATARSAGTEQPTQATPATAPGVVLDRVAISIEAPHPARETDGIAKVSMTVTCHGNQDGTFLAFPRDFVLTRSTLDAREGRIEPAKQGFLVHLRCQGARTFTFEGMAPILSSSGTWLLDLQIPLSLENTVRLHIPATGWDASCAQAALLEQVEGDHAVTCTMSMATLGQARLVWRPKERVARLEQTVFYGDVQSYVAFMPGLVSLTHVVRYQVAQGELQTLRFRIPEGMSVTAVTGKGVGTWRYDPGTHQLEALMERPMSGDFELVILTQIPREGLPYTAAIGMLTLDGAARQRGAIVLAASGAVQVRVDDAKGASPMNTGDFPKDVVACALSSTRFPETPEIKRAFRYQDLSALIATSAERVVPELRVTEEASLDISDERLILTSRMELQITRAGLFELRLDLPQEYDIESLGGDDIAYWDEVREGGRGVIIHFTRQALGTHSLNLVLGRVQHGVESQIRIPGIGVRDAVKHVGTLAVSGERGVRFVTSAKEGVSEVHPRELGIERPGYLAFRLLRPDWSVILKTETLAPVVRAESLLRVDVSEGMIRGHCGLRYKIDQAGVKLFRLKAPAPGVALVISGKSIAKVSEIDRASGLWEVELQGKVETHYAMDVDYQQPYDPAAQTLKILPVRAIGADSQRGYVVVFTSGPLQVRTDQTPEALHAEDARNIPALFGAGDCSDAIYCYRTIQPDFSLDLSVVRHERADVLPARVEQVGLTTIMADDGQILTRVAMRLNAGSLRFLEATLPAEAQLWSVFVNDASSLPLQDHGTILIPLGSARVSGEATLELTYVGMARTGHALGRTQIEGPRFNIPLADINWDIFVPPDYHCHGFGGSLAYQDNAPREALSTFGKAQYERDNLAATLVSNGKAEGLLKAGENLWKQGRQAEAKQALQQAVILSQGQQELNEDARIQYRNLARHQAVVGFYNRRNALKRAQNVMDDTPSPGASLDTQAQGGQWTADYGQQVERALGAEEAGTLNKVADKMLEQQAAAQARATPIRVTLPQEGLHLAFHRPLQITPGAEMVVHFSASNGWAIRLLTTTGSVLLLVGTFWWFARRCTGPAGRSGGA